MAWLVKAPPAKPDDLNLVPKTHVVGGENRLSQVLFSDFHTEAMAHTWSHITPHTQIKNKIIVTLQKPL